MARGRTRRARRGDEPDMPLSSFSDIAFLLIIYFILAASLTQDVGIRTDIPAGEKATEAAEETRTVVLHEDGLTWGQQTITIEALRDELDAMDLPAKDDSDRVVQFEARGEVPWQRYYEVLAAIENAGGIPGILMEVEAEQ